MTNKIFNKNYFGILTLSSSILIFELLLIRIFSVVLKSNLAFFAITITLFGVAMGGLIVSLINKYFTSENFYKRIFQYSLSFGVSLIIFYFLFFHLNFTDLNIIQFILLIILSVTPFILGNIALVLFFQNKSSEIKIIYFFDLIGAGLGVIIAIIIMNFWGAVNGLLFASLLAILSSYFFIQKNNKYKIILFIILIISILGLILNIKYDFIKITNTKIGSEEGIIVFNKWNSFSRITTQEDNISHEMTNEIPKKYKILIDSDAETSVINFDGDFSKVSYLKYDLTSTPYHLIDPGTSLIIGPGGGRDVLSALLLGFRVKGVEINPIIVNDVMKDKLVNFSGNLYNRDDVDIIISEGRSYLEKNKDLYSIIHIPLVDTWSSTISGNLTLVESYLYTVEAFKQYLNHLETNGILSFTRWELDGMRLVSLFLEASDQLNMPDAEKNIAIVSRDIGENFQLNNYLFKKTPFTDEELSKLNKFVSEVDYKISYSPGLKLNTIYYDYINAPDRQKFIKNYEKNINPVYDNNPFYFFTSPINKAVNLDRKNYGITFLMMFFATLLISVLIIILPLFIKKKIQNMIRHSKSQSFLLILYFSLLGLGFLLLEISLIQKFILYLEQPIYSYSVVLISLLMSAGIGSFVSEKISSDKKKNFLIIAITIFFLVIIGYLSFDPLIQSSIGLNITYKILFAILINMPVAFFMGMMLPMGIKRLELLKREDLIPWAWSSNGAMSVLASILAILLALLFGLNTVMVIAGVLYILTPVVIYFSPNTNNK